MRIRHKERIILTGYFIFNFIHIIFYSAGSAHALCTKRVQTLPFCSRYIEGLLAKVTVALIHGNSGNPTLTFQKIDQAGILGRHGRKPGANPVTIPPQALWIALLCKCIPVQNCPDISRRIAGEGIAGKKLHGIGVVMKKFPGKV